MTQFVWLRQFEPGSNSADANRLLDRLEHLRRLDVPEGLFHEIPPLVETHDRIVGKTYREAARACEAQLGDETAAVRESLRAFTELGRALIGARDTGEALDAVIANGARSSDLAAGAAYRRSALLHTCGVWASCTTPFRGGSCASCSAGWQWARRLRPSMRQVHRAGEKTFIDFSGKRPTLVDPRTGEVRRVELFVAALGASSFTVNLVRFPNAAGIDLSAQRVGP